ncbi:MAG: hypothetical protein HC903_02430 [Methylacidiphilales bacterium]|nr:hypothetical protein [Candidatus Methylacidiphilales bacterium]NJR16554.1 hypothetical protein [Calothrix sp. CSU_2_0]
MLNTTLFKHVSITAVTVSMVGLSSVISAKSSQATLIPLPLPLENFTYTNGETTSVGAFESIFDENYGLLNQGGVATSGASPFINSAVIGRLKSIKVSSDYAFNQKKSNDTFQLFLQKGSTQNLLTTLLPDNDGGQFNLDFTKIFKDVFQAQGEGTFNLVYKLSGSGTESIAGFDNVKLVVEVPEPTTTVAGFLMLTLVAGGVKRQRKIAVALVPNSNLKSN